MNKPGTLTAARMTAKCKEATGIQVTTSCIRSDLDVGLSRQRALLGYKITITRGSMRHSDLLKAQSQIVSWARKEYPQLQVRPGGAALFITLRRKAIP